MKKMNLFDLGQIVATNRVWEWMKDDITRTVWLECKMDEHVTGQWDHMGEDAQLNRDSVTGGGRIHSAFDLRTAHEGDTSVWIITEADRSSTTILFPSDY